MSTLGLAALGLTAVFGLAVVIAFPTVGQTILRILQGTFLLLLALTLIGLLVMAITNIDIDPYIRHGAVMQTGHRLVDFYTLLPEQSLIWLMGAALMRVLSMIPTGAIHRFFFPTGYYRPIGTI
jgi:hypothetical protein